MYTVTYIDRNGARKPWSCNTNSKQRFALFLAQFPRPIVAIFFGSTPVTETMRKELRKWSGVLDMSKDAREFMNPAIPEQTVRQS